MSSTPAIGLRPATPADAEFCYQLHKAAMGDYITAIWGWDEQVQRASHERAFNPDRWRIITAGQADVGMLDVDYRPGEIYLSRIEIHPGRDRDPRRPSPDPCRDRLQYPRFHRAEQVPRKHGAALPLGGLISAELQ